MSDNMIDDLIEFLKNANLTTYEINVYITLLNSTSLTAREISIKSNVPYGRIYDILDELKNKGMIDIFETRPKTCKSYSFNKALRNLLEYQKNENKRKTQFLYEQATKLESKFYDSDLFIKKELTKIFWSKIFGTLSIKNQYIKYIHELKEDLLLTGFITPNIFERLSYFKDFFGGLNEAINRGVKIKYLWSFELDNRAMTYVEILNNRKKFGKLVSWLQKTFNLEIVEDSFEMKFIHRRIPNYFDIFDKERIIIKLQNLSIPSQIYSCLNMIDLKLAKLFRKEFLDTWLNEGIEDNPEAYKHTFMEQLEKSFLR